MVDVVIGLFEKDPAELTRKAFLVRDAGEEAWIQIDIADGTLVPVHSVTSMDTFASIISSCPNISFEAHLMVANPEKYIKPLADCGFKRITAHVEAQDPRLFLDDAKFESVEVGLAIDGPTELEQIEPFVEELDFVLVMTIEAGASGQEMLPETIEKIKALHEHYPDLPIEVDGGVNEHTVKVVVDAGASRVVSTTYVLKDPDNITKRIKKLQS